MAKKSRKPANKKSSPGPARAPGRGPADSAGPSDSPPSAERRDGHDPSRSPSPSTEGGVPAGRYVKPDERPGPTLLAYGLGDLPSELVSLLNQLERSPWGRAIDRRPALDALAHFVRNQLARTNTAGYSQLKDEGDEVDMLRAEDKHWTASEVELERIGVVWLHHLPALLVLEPMLTEQTLGLHSDLAALRPSLLQSVSSLTYPTATRTRNAVGSLFVALSNSSISSIVTNNLIGQLLADDDNDSSRALDILAYCKLAILQPLTILDSLDNWLNQYHRKLVRSIDDKADEEVESVWTDQVREDARDAQVRIRTEALRALARLVKERVGASSKDDSPPLSQLLANRRLWGKSVASTLSRMLVDPRLWTSLSKTPADGADLNPLGFQQAGVRTAGWELLAQVVDSQPDAVRPALKPISLAVFSDCWAERDKDTVKAIIASVGPFLHTFPEAWMVAHACAQEKFARAARQTGRPEADVDGACFSEAYDGLLRFMRSGCVGCPLEGYPFVVDAVQSLPRHILPLSDAALQALSDAFWAAEPLLTPASAERRALLFAILTCNSKLLEERLALGDPLAIIFADSQTARLREAGGIPVFGGPSGRADQEGMSDEDEFEYGYDDEGDEDEEDLEDEEEEVEGDRLSEGSGADEREVEWGPGTRWGFEYGQEVLDAHSSFPTCLRLRFPLLPSSLLALLSSHPSIHHLDLSHLPYPTISGLLTSLVPSDIPCNVRHISLLSSLSHSPGPTPSDIVDLEAAILALLPTLRTLEYIDLRGTSLFTTEDSLSPLVDLIADDPRTCALQMVWFPPRRRWANTPWDYLRDRLTDQLGTNRKRRELAHRRAVGLLGVARGVMLGGGGDHNLGGLPGELLREVVGWSEEGKEGLSRKQVGRVIRWGERRETLGGGHGEGGQVVDGRRDWLERVGCWRVEI